MLAVGITAVTTAPPPILPARLTVTLPNTPFDPPVPPVTGGTCAQVSALRQRELLKERPGFLRDEEHVRVVAVEEIVATPWPAVRHLRS